MGQESLRFGGRSMGAIGVLGGVAIALGLPYLVLTFGQGLGPVMQGLIVIGALVIGGGVACVAAFFGAVMPTVIEGQGTVVKGKPVRVDLKAADGEVVVSRVEAGGTGAPADQA